jgi:hypothetical protein
MGSATAAGVGAQQFGGQAGKMSQPSAPIGMKAGMDTSATDGMGKQQGQPASESPSQRPDTTNVEATRDKSEIEMGSKNSSASTRDEKFATQEPGQEKKMGGWGSGIRTGTSSDLHADDKPLPKAFEQSKTQQSSLGAKEKGSNNSSSGARSTPAETNSTTSKSATDPTIRGSSSKD